MANITFLEATNRVLTRLRENSVSTLSGANNYVALIAAYVNEAKEEVEAAWNWNCEHTELNITLANGDNTYSLTNFGDEFKIELVFNTTKNFYLKGPYTTAELIASAALASDNLSGPYTWGLVGKDSSGDPQIRLYPTPVDTDNLLVVAKVKGSYLTSDTDEIKVPWRPVVLCAYLKAVGERGEDGGISYEEAYLAYERALADAIGYDAAAGHTVRDWVAD